MQLDDHESIQLVVGPMDDIADRVIASVRPRDRGPAEPSISHRRGPDLFLQTVEDHLGERKNGAIGYVELVWPGHDAQAGAASLADASLSSAGTLDEVGDLIDGLLGPDDIFCWFGGRFIVLLDRTAAARRKLSQISRGIANREWQAQGTTVHLTPVIGYVDLRLAASARELWDMADEALQRAKMSLDIEPYRYVAAGKSRAGMLFAKRPQVSRKRTPTGLVLFLQLMVTLLLGLGGPFILYAVCDALGADISGPVYIGVVIVLVITATMIWIEGFLALKPTTPPLEPGAPYPVATLIIPAYLPNEAATIMETLHAFLRIEYANVIQIIVAYNSPKALPVENEMRELAEEHSRGGRFLIEPIRVAGSTSKAQNVNAVIGRVKGRFVGIFDADHHPHPDSLQRAWRWLSNGWDIVQGRCSIRNGADSWVARMVAVEFEQIYAVNHPGRARFHGFGIFGGSNGFWRTSVLHETRMRHTMLTEDIDSSIRAMTAGYRIAGDRDLISEELAPTTMKQLLNQRLRWAQGWFQVSLRRVIPSLFSPRVTFQQKLGLLHLLVWRELFPWYSIQVVPIMTYWVWVYGWAHIRWTVPIFLVTTVYTLATGPAQILLAYRLAHKPMRARPNWFVSYFFLSMLFYAPFKDALSRIAHVKEAMREKSWKVTPRVATQQKGPGLIPAATASLLVLATGMSVDRAHAAPATGQRDAPSAPYILSRELIETYLGGEASTINAARTAASQGRHADAARLFEAAIRDVPSRRGELLREYADALTYGGRSAEAVPLYRELLAAQRDSSQRRDTAGHLALALNWSHQSGPARLASQVATTQALAAARPAPPRQPPTPRQQAAYYRAELARIGPGSMAGRKAQRELAMALTAADEPEQAVTAWTGYLRYAPADESALLRKAELLTQLHRDADARDAYEAAYSVNRDQAARIGVVNATVSLARAAARENRNADAVSLFASATALDSSHDPELVREYADQLSFAGRSADAIPLYLQVLKSSGLSSLDYQRSLVGLADAYSWTNRLVDALPVYTQLVNAAPGNPDYRWAKLTCEARIAARTDHNAESAGLFAQAIALDPKKRTTLLPEYADQLSYVGLSKEAIALYQEAILQPAIAPRVALNLSIGLAQAYALAGRYTDAEAEYRMLIKANPRLEVLQYKLWVVSARDAAIHDKNEQSSMLFAKAIRSDPEHSKGLLREYADQLSFSGRAAYAPMFYSAALRQPSLTNKDQVAISRAQAQALEWTGQYTAAAAIYDALLKTSPDDPTLRWHRMVLSAREQGRADHNQEAAKQFSQAIKFQPERRMDILKEYADQLTYSNQASAAIPLYHELLLKSTSEASHHDIELALARALSWNHQLKDALSVYDRLAALSATDVAARLGVARTLSWMGHQGAARTAYQNILVVDATNAEALRGLAQVEDWDGRHFAAQALLHRRLAQDPNDIAAHQLLAQSLVWSGRPDVAMTEVKLALRNHPAVVRSKSTNARNVSGINAASDNVQVNKDSD